MTFQARVYVFGVDDEGYREFLHTTLDRQEAVDYIVKFHGIFPWRFQRFVYGTIDDGFQSEVDYGKE